MYFSNDVNVKYVQIRNGVLLLKIYKNNVPVRYPACKSENANVLVRHLEVELWQT